ERNVTSLTRGLRSFNAEKLTIPPDTTSFLSHSNFLGTTMARSFPLFSYFWPMEMESRIQELLEKVKQYTAANKQEVENFRLQFISKKGAIAELFDKLKTLTAEQKKAVGRTLNELKQTAEAKLSQLNDAVNASASPDREVDLTLPPVPNAAGNLHPLSLTRYRIIEIFERLGFNVEDGPEIENDWANFSALNFPENHPAREMQDTFFIEKGSAAGEDRKS